MRPLGAVCLGCQRASAVSGHLQEQCSVLSAGEGTSVACLPTGSTLQVNQPPGEFPVECDQKVGQRMRDFELETFGKVLDSCLQLSGGLP